MNEPTFEKPLVGRFHEPPWRSLLSRLVQPYAKVEVGRQIVYELLALYLQGGSDPQGASFYNVPYALCPAYNRMSSQWLRFEGSHQTRLSENSSDPFLISFHSTISLNLVSAAPRRCQ